jgi:hypothetical protein
MTTFAHPRVPDTRTDRDHFRWWPELVLRGAGFPASGVLALADRDLGRLADGMTGVGIDRKDDRAAWKEFGEQYAAATAAMVERLRQIAAASSFQRAVAWQNHDVLPRAIEPFVRRPAGETRNAKNRQREELIAAYWQRYCLKNDTIGFFGPVAWAWQDDRPHTEVVVGDGLVRRATVYFERWAVDRLVEVIKAQPGLRRWLAPRRMPYLRLTGGGVELPVGAAIAVSPAQESVLRACEGMTRACDIGGAETLDILADLERRRWITWRIDLPESPFPERDLRSVLERIDDDVLRAACLRPLDEMEACRDAVAEASDVAGLTEALAAADRVFHDITGAAGHRHGGQAYGGRTLMYQDCARDLDAVFGQDVMAATEPIDLLARGCRWLCWQAAQAARVALSAVYRQLSATGEPVGLARFWAAALGPLRQQVSKAMDEAQADYVARWESILRPEPGAAEVSRSYAELLPLVRTAFDTPGVGWGAARYLSPDLMIAAPDLAAVHRGDFRLVVGEIHLALNSQRSSCFVTQHPNPDSLLRHVDVDFPQPRLLPAPPRSGPVRRSVRNLSLMTRDTDLLVELHHHTVLADRPGLLPSAGISVSEVDSALVAVLPGGERFDLLDIFSEILVDIVLNAHSLFTARDHSPRVVIDRVVVHRESWRFAPAGLRFATEKDEARRFVAARAWRRSMGLPPRVFVKPGGTDKPVYVDFDSPVLVNTLAKILRGADQDQPIGFSELLPDLDQLWLMDSDGERYTSELRFAMVDQLEENTQ